MQTALPSQQKRIDSIDLLRGLVMIMMVWDHVRIYFYAGNALFEKPDILKTGAVPFFIKLFTHWGAPPFIFLAGTAAFLKGQRITKKELSVFLVSRGIWLMLLELTIVNFGWYFNPSFTVIRLGVIWALGACMILLAVLIHFPYKIILAIGLLILFGHNLLDYTHIAGNNWKAFLWSALHEPGKFMLPGGRILRVTYCILPWSAIMILGFCLGWLYKKEITRAQRKKWLIMIGSAAVFLFLLLRFINVYGERIHWAVQPSALYTVFSFLNTTKYPPSLLHTLMTLGPALIFLAYAETLLKKPGNPIVTIGRVPMFYYLLHLYLIHAAAMIAMILTGRPWTAMILTGNDTIQQGYGFSLWVVTGVSMVILLLLYPLCKWYDKYKSKHKEKWWLSYL